jgi:EAL domain-containing protein (putative c-di-GMP-specific phosphodiesterase class I)
MASALGLYVVAEGIETAEQAEELRRMGCDAGQGFHYAPALPRDEIERWLRA